MAAEFIMAVFFIIARRFVHFQAVGIEAAQDVHEDFIEAVAGVFDRNDDAFLMFFLEDRRAVGCREGIHKGHGFGFVFRFHNAVSLLARC